MAVDVAESLPEQVDAVVRFQCHASGVIAGQNGSQWVIASPRFSNTTVGISLDPSTTLPSSTDATVRGASRLRPPGVTIGITDENQVWACRKRILVPAG